MSEVEFPTSTKLQATLLAAFDEVNWKPVTGPAGYSTLAINGIYITVEPKRDPLGVRGPDLSEPTLQRIADAVCKAVNDAGWPCERPEMVKMNHHRYSFYAWRIKG